MNKHDTNILHAVDRCTRGKRVKIGVVTRDNISIAKELAQKGHRVVLIGDKFKALYKFTLENKQYNPALTVESRYFDMPILQGSVDVLIVNRPMQPKNSIDEQIMWLKQFVKPGGTLMWLHPVYEGLFGTLKKKLNNAFYHTPRHGLCAIAMKSGLKQIGQVALKRNQKHMVLTFGEI